MFPYAPDGGSRPPIVAGLCVTIMWVLIDHDLGHRLSALALALPFCPMNSPLQPLDRRLLRNRRGALTLAAALAAFVPLCWTVIQLHGSFPGDSHFISQIRHPHPGEPLGFLAHIFALLGNPIVAALCVAIVWVLIDDGLAWTITVLVIGLPWAAGLRHTGDHL